MDNERLKDAGDFPKVILLDTTNFCNLRCSMCSHRIMTREKGRMSMELYRKLIDEIAEKDKNIRLWMVFFGEALILRHRLFWQILYAKRKGLTDVVLNSNGMLLDKENCLGLIESGLDAIYVGIDAFSEDTYNKLRVGGKYYEVTDNVNRLLYMKSELGVDNPKVFVQFVETEENRDEVDDFKAYWSGQGASVKVRPKITWAGTVSPYGNKKEKRYPCYWAMQTMNICWDGRVVLCSVDYDAKYVAGNVNEKSIQSIWLDNLKKIRETHLKGDWKELPEFCQKCMDWQMARAEYC